LLLSCPRFSVPLAHSFSFPSSTISPELFQLRVYSLEPLKITFAEMRLELSFDSALSVFPRLRDLELFPILQKKSDWSPYVSLLHFDLNLSDPLGFCNDAIILASNFFHKASVPRCFRVLPPPPSVLEDYFTLLVK